jgi:Dienelactone hydrolase and related enzymes
MADEKNDLSRRDFVAMSLAAGLAAAAGETLVSGAALPVEVSDVSVKTPDGMCDAAFIHPASGSHPGVLIWPDAFGLRPAMIDIGKRIAGEGYSVLVPNPYYRMSKAPGVDMNGFSFQNQADMAKLRPLMGSINAPGAAEKDAVAFIAFLDEQKQVNTAKKIGTQGYCMGGPLVMKNGGGRVQSRRRRRVVPRRRPRHRSAHQSAPARAQDEGAPVRRHRRQRRPASARCEGQAEGGL